MNTRLLALLGVAAVVMAGVVFMNLEAKPSAGDAAVNASRDVSRDGENAIEKASQAAGAATQTAKVQAALVADSKVDASGINVDTDADTKTITLKGHVPSKAQKAAAERIAVEKASAGYTVRNELVVH